MIGKFDIESIKLYQNDNLFLQGDFNLLSIIGVCFFVLESAKFVMDIDKETEAPGSNNIDIEQSLLQQFSCMGTTDKDELVQQLQKLLGSHLNHSTATFFLDMNNW